MFGSNDNKDNPQDVQIQHESANSPTGPNPPAPVHAPFSKISPGSAPNTPSPKIGPAIPPTFKDINLPGPSAPVPPAGGGDDNKLLDIKHQALQNLAPLVTHLDQSAEERFKTTMMLIQASDNSQLINQAYEAANQIEDEKVRAQALLDVVNEINYFTHQKNSQNSQT